MARDPILFLDRQDAGVQLARALRRLRLLHPLVLGLPRGGVVVAAEVARALGGELDLVVAKKLGAPRQPELAVGAVGEDGSTCWNAEVLAALGLVPSALLAGRERAAREAVERARTLRGGLAPVPIAGRDVVVVDDGLATGATLRAALRCVARAKPARLVAAVPVGAADACRALRLEVPELVCLAEPEDFVAVGGFYARFPQVEDAEVVRLLRSHAARPLPSS